MSAKTTLITGFPHNLLAKHVVRRLLKDLENLQLRCVVQKPHLEFAASLIAQWSCENRVQLLEGETSAMDFGLSGSEYNELIREVEVLHHCDSTENNELDPKTIESINIGGVREALEFCESAKNLAHLIHWSTTLVSGTRKGYVSEDELETPPGFHDRIEESRFHAEKVLRESMDRYPITILKPSRLMGDSTTGEIDRFSGPYLLVLLMLNAPPDLRLPMPGRG
ncbi:MAG: SDR family oxidoreductase, partial [Myxococcota bacterium]